MKRTQFIALVSFVLLLLSGYLFPEYLQYHRQALGQGQWWRLITAHFCHWDLNHLTCDFIVFTALYMALSESARQEFHYFALPCAALMSLYFFSFIPEMPTYRGLSGLDCSLVIFLIVDLWKHQRLKPYLVASVLLLTLKVGIEALSNHSLFNSGDLYITLWQAHALGAIFAISFKLIRKAFIEPPFHPL